MIDEIHERMILLYLKYAEKKCLSAEEFLMFRQQAIQELHLLPVDEKKEYEAEKKDCSIPQSSLKTEEKRQVPAAKPVRQTAASPINANNAKREKTAPFSQSTQSGTMTDEAWLEWVGAMKE